MTIELEKTLGPADLAVLLRRKESTIKVDARRRPETLPPRFQVPGTNRLMWLETDVLEWMEMVRQESKLRHQAKTRGVSPT